MASKLESAAGVGAGLAAARPRFLTTSRGFFRRSTMFGTYPLSLRWLHPGLIIRMKPDFSTDYNFFRAAAVYFEPEITR
ncbi:MAG: hypothetical protein IT565_00320 [Rhodospirillales bacterium]|nr:hypothetical protein [Rhodospirillales bacterium]